MTNVINNGAFDDRSPMRPKRDRYGSSSSSTYEDRRKPSPREGDRSKESPNRKKERHSPPLRVKDHVAADPNEICNGCGRKLTEKHTEETCWYIKDKLEGYNPHYKSVKW